jgi:predicted alpha/beta superfamily hydrolase
MNRRQILLGGIGGLWGVTGQVGAQPAQTVTPSLAQQPVASHTFTSLRFSSADSLRHYRVEVAIPHRPAPASGFPSLFLCDGNAAFMALKPADLEAAPELVVVAMGYDTSERFDLVSRNYDYTPAINGPDTVDEMTPANRAGGAEAFTALIHDTLLPMLAAEIPLDPARRALWGHSLGGLFVLHTRFRHPDMFRSYTAASPSLWWYEARAFTDPPLPPLSPCHVLLIAGGAEVNRRVIAGRAMPPPGETVAALKAMGERLGAETLILPGLNHGPVFTASLPLAVQFATKTL